MAVQYIDNGNPDGSVFGQAASALIAFHGATPTDQPATIAKPAATSATNSSPYGFGQTQADALVTAVRSIIDVLIEKGLIAAS